MTFTTFEQAERECMQAAIKQRLADLDRYRCVARNTLEPEAAEVDAAAMRAGANLDAATLSIAISLKRIADALAMVHTEPVNSYGETILPAITRAISDGVAGR